MDLVLFNRLTETTGPFASVTIDLTHTDPATSDRHEARWRDLEGRLRGAGAPDDVVERVAEAALEPSGQGGECGRLVVANTDGVLLAQDLPRRPEPDAAWGPVPSLLAAVHAVAGYLPHVVVTLDRTGADVEVRRGPDDGARGQVLEVSGDHDELHRVQSGGMAQRRFQARVEDSLEHNAARVAEELDRIVRANRPASVVLMGDEKAMSFLEEHASAELRSVLARVNTGGRGDGTSEHLIREATESVLARTRAELEAGIVDRFEEQSGRAEAASEGLESVVDVFQRAQVEELLLIEGREHEQQLWVGEDGLQLGVSREDAKALGADDPVLVPADAALVWAAVCSRAGVTLLDSGQANPADGVAALLRWSDESTPRARVPSMPGHGGT
ncbi:MAG: hypothetical protein JF622_14155 [Terrabacter sp.]|nr:hypothetical protein [Terrabacter sp.]